MKASVKYAIRAAKYFCWFLILFTLLIGVLVLTKFVPADIDTMFVKGWISVAEIAGVFVVFSHTAEAKQSYFHGNPQEISL